MNEELRMANICAHGDFNNGGDVYGVDREGVVWRMRGDGWERCNMSISSFRVEPVELPSQPEKP